MKKIIFIALIIIALPYVISKLNVKDSMIETNEIISRFIPSDENSLSSIKFGDEKFSYSLFSPTEKMQITFNLNLNDKLPSLDIIDKQKCTYLINGGFYDKLDQPIGLVIKDGLEISKNQKNPLFNGYLSATDSAQFNITSSRPSLESIVGIQTGPILIKDSKSQTLKLISDQQKRRMVLIVSDNNVPFFTTIFSEENQIEGPLLKNLPKIIELISKEEKIIVKDAINLDGGSASTFYTPDIHIKEFSSIGSYICFK